MKVKSVSTVEAGLILVGIFSLALGIASGTLFLVSVAVAGLLTVPISNFITKTRRRALDRSEEDLRRVRYGSNEPESSIISDSAWNELAYGSGSTHHLTQEAIDRIQYELDAPERQLRDARNWARDTVRYAEERAQTIIHHLAKIEATRAEAKELDDFIEWMGDDGVRRDGTQGPVRISEERMGYLSGRPAFSSGGWMDERDLRREREAADRDILQTQRWQQDIAESQIRHLFGVPGSTAASYLDDGVSFCLGRRVFTKRFVQDYDPNRLSYVSCTRGPHYHKNDGSL